MIPRVRMNPRVRMKSKNEQNRLPTLGVYSRCDILGCLNKNRKVMIIVLTS